ncbi:MAG: hypothetical protein QOF76_4927 [Solirubrobacteraceae bacterium]|jgi:predicted ester cyclase|nr:hypothetical protein [Solirubrobacteraceae bacterium]
MPDAAPLQLARRMLAAYEAQDLAAVDELVHPDHRDHDRSAKGRESVRAAIRWLGDTFADVELVCEDMIAAGDRLVARVRFSATQIGEFEGRAATGRRLSVQHIHIWRVADGLLVEHWMVRDDLGAVRQLDAEEVAW